MVFQHQEMNCGLMVALVEKGVTLTPLKGCWPSPLKLNNWIGSSGKR